MTVTPKMEALHYFCPVVLTWNMLGLHIPGSY